MFAGHILASDSLSHRVEVLEHIIEIGEKFLEFQNYHGVQIVNAALSMSCISRLKPEWSKLGKRFIIAKDSLFNAMNPVRKQENHRKPKKKTNISLFFVFRLEISKIIET